MAGEQAGIVGGGGERPFGGLGGGGDGAGTGGRWGAGDRAFGGGAGGRAGGGGGGGRRREGGGAGCGGGDFFRSGGGTGIVGWDGGLCSWRVWALERTGSRGAIRTRGVGHVGGGNGRVHVLPSERFVMPAVVRTPVADHAKQLIVPPVQDAPERQPLGESNLGGVFPGAAAHVKDGAREVDDEHFGKGGDLHVARDFALRGFRNVGELDVLGGDLWVVFQGFLDCCHGDLQGGFLLRGGCAGKSGGEGIMGMLEAAFVAFIVIDVLEFEVGVEALIERSRTFLRDHEV